MELCLELGIPIQDVDIDVVNRIHADIPLLVAIREPLRARIVRCAVDDVGNVLLCHESLC